jgi:Uma2 family endonuclease
MARWERMPELKFAELIDEVVYMPSPGSVVHGRYDLLANGWALAYVAATGTCEAVSDSTWLMMGSAPQPGVALRRLSGGMSREEGNFLAGAPELIVEICRSSRAYDLGPKLALYQRAGVQEYVAVLLEERRIEWR